MNFDELFRLPCYFDIFTIFSKIWITLRNFCPKLVGTPSIILTRHLKKSLIFLLLLLVGNEINNRKWNLTENSPKNGKGDSKLWKEQKHWWIPTWNFKNPINEQKKTIKQPTATTTSWVMQLYKNHNFTVYPGCTYGGWLATKKRSQTTR